MCSPPAAVVVRQPRLAVRAGPVGGLQTSSAGTCRRWPILRRIPAKVGVHRRRSARPRGFGQRSGRVRAIQEVGGMIGRLRRPAVRSDSGASTNLHRRHLTSAQRAMNAARARHRFEKAAEKRQHEAGKQGKRGGRGKKKPLASIDAKGLSASRPPSQRTLASEEAGRAAKVSASPPGRSSPPKARPRRLHRGPT